MGCLPIGWKARRGSCGGGSMMNWGLPLFFYLLVFISLPSILSRFVNNCPPCSFLGRLLRISREIHIFIHPFSCVSKPIFFSVRSQICSQSSGRNDEISIIDEQAWLLPSLIGSRLETRMGQYNAVPCELLLVSLPNLHRLSERDIGLRPGLDRESRAF